MIAIIAGIVPGALPLATAPMQGDPALLEAAVAQLIENAARYNVTAGAVELHTWTERDHACLSVGNDGPRVDPRDVEQLFERPHDGDRRGVGLGLAIVDGIVCAHGGTVDASARSRGGLYVTFRLPAGAPR